MSTRDLITNVVIRAMILKGKADLKDMHRHAKGARKRNEDLLFKILKTSKDSEFGRKHGFSEIASVEDYRRAVPISDFSDYEDYIVRMIDGNEENLLTSLPLVGYAQSSGSVGKRKFVPLTQPEINIYTKYTVTRMLGLADDWRREKTGKGLKPGRGMFIPPSFDDTLPNGLPCSNSADVAARQLGFIYPYILHFPLRKHFNEQQAESKYINLRFGLEDKDTTFIFAIFFKEYTGLMRYLEKNWEQIVDDIEQGTISDLAHATDEAKELLKPYLKPNPERAAELRAEFEQGFDNIIERVWPNIGALYGIGTSTFTPFAKATRKYAHNVPFDYSIYGASEGLFAAVDALDSAPQLMLPDSCFFEFIPVDKPDTCLELDELTVGNEYEVIITNQAGLYRYSCGDVVKCVGYLDECPYIEFSYRKGQLLNMTGEKTTEEHMAAVVKAVGKKAGIPMGEWATFIATTEEPYHYMLLIENADGVDLTQYSQYAHEKLMEINPRYAYFFMQGAYSAIQIMNQAPGTHAAWDAKRRAEQGIGEFQAKPVRVIDNEDKAEFFLSRVVVGE